MNEQEIFEKLNKDFECVNKQFGEENILGIFMFGENCQTEAIRIPTFEEVCLNESLTNTVVINNNDNCIIVRDIRLIYNATKNGFPEIISSLYTDYYIINPRYEHMFIKLLRANRNAISAGINISHPAEELKIAIMKIMRTAMNENSSAVRFIKQLTDAEKLAIEGVVQEIGDEGVLSQAKVAAKIGIARKTMTSLCMKMELYGVAKVESLGPKGTYIKFIDDTLLNIRGEKA